MIGWVPKSVTAALENAHTVHCNRQRQMPYLRLGTRHSWRECLFTRSLGSGRWCSSWFLPIGWAKVLSLSGTLLTFLWACVHMAAICISLGNCYFNTYADCFSLVSLSTSVLLGGVYPLAVWGFGFISFMENFILLCNSLSAFSMTAFLYWPLFLLKISPT